MRQGRSRHFMQLHDAVTAEAARRVDAGESLNAVARSLNIKKNTLHCRIADWRCRNEVFESPNDRDRRHIERLRVRSDLIRLRRAIGKHATLARMNGPAAPPTMADLLRPPRVGG